MQTNKEKGKIGMKQKSVLTIGGRPSAKLLIEELRKEYQEEKDLKILSMEKAKVFKLLPKPRKKQKKRVRVRVSKAKSKKKGRKV